MGKPYSDDLRDRVVRRWLAAEVAVMWVRCSMWRGARRAGPPETATAPPRMNERPVLGNAVSCLNGRNVSDAIRTNSARHEANVGKILRITPTALAKEAPCFPSTFGYEELTRVIFSMPEESKADEWANGPVTDHVIGIMFANEYGPSRRAALSESWSKMPIAGFITTTTKDGKADTPKGVSRAWGNKGPFDRAGVGLFSRGSCVDGAMSHTVAVCTFQGLGDGASSIDGQPILSIGAVLGNNSSGNLSKPRLAPGISWYAAKWLFHAVAPE